MAENREKIGSDELLIIELAQGKTVADAAKEAGVSERTAHRRLANPDFKRRVSEARRQILDQAIGVLARASTAAATRLCTLLKAGSENVQLKAAIAILELSAKFRGQLELEDRLSELENIIANQ